MDPKKMPPAALPGVPWRVAFFVKKAPQKNFWVMGALQLG